MYVGTCACVCVCRHGDAGLACLHPQPLHGWYFLMHVSVCMFSRNGLSLCMFPYVLPERSVLMHVLRCCNAVLVNVVTSLSLWLFFPGRLCEWSLSCFFLNLLCVCLSPISSLCVCVSSLPGASALGLDCSPLELSSHLHSSSLTSLCHSRPQPNLSRQLDFILDDSEDEPRGVRTLAPLPPSSSTLIHLLLSHLKLFLTLILITAVLIIRPQTFCLLFLTAVFITLLFYHLSLPPRRSPSPSLDSVGSAQLGSAQGAGEESRTQLEGSSKGPGRKDVITSVPLKRSSSLPAPAPTPGESADQDSTLFLSPQPVRPGTEVRESCCGSVGLCVCLCVLGARHVGVGIL